MDLIVAFNSFNNKILIFFFVSFFSFVNSIATNRAAWMRMSYFAPKIKS